MNRTYILKAIAILVFLFFSSCASNQMVSTGEHFDAVIQGTATLDYVDAQRESSLAMGAENTDFYVELQSKEHIRIDYSNKESVKMHLNLDTYLTDQSLVQEIFFIDNYQYININESNIKAPTPMSNVIYLVEGIKPFELQAADMEELSMEVIDSMYVFTFSVKSEHILKYASKIFTLPEGLNFASDFVKLDEGSFQGTITAGIDNKIISSSFTADMNLSILGIIVPFSAENNTTYNSFNIPFEIVFPNFDEYIETELN